MFVATLMKMYRISLADIKDAKFESLNAVEVDVVNVNDIETHLLLPPKGSETNCFFLEMTIATH